MKHLKGKRNWIVKDFKSKSLCEESVFDYVVILHYIIIIIIYFQIGWIIVDKWGVFHSKVQLPW